MNEKPGLQLLPQLFRKFFPARLRCRIEVGRSGGIRTHMGFTPADFKSAASAIPPPTRQPIVENPPGSVNSERGHIQGNCIKLEKTS